MQLYVVWEWDHDTSTIIILWYGNGSTYYHYIQYGNEIRQYLPRADNSGSRKKTLWKTLFEGFDQIDGKPSQADKEVTSTHTHTHTTPMQ